MVSRDMALLLWAERSSGAVEGSPEPAAVMEAPNTETHGHGHSPATGCKATGMCKATRMHGHWRASSQAHAAVPVRRACTPRCPCCRHGPDDAQPNTGTCALARALSPSLVPDMERKKF